MEKEDGKELSEEMERWRFWARKKPPSCATVSSTAASVPSNGEHTSTANGASIAGGSSTEMVSVLSGVSFELKARSLVGIIGAVGCGKTTLLAAAWGEAFAFDGEMRVTDDLAIVPQKVGCPSSLSGCFSTAATHINSRAMLLTT